MERFAVLVLVALLLGAAPVGAADPPPLAKARELYNAGDYDGAIAAAGEARRLPEWADAAALVIARSHLERYRRRQDPADLTAARETLAAVGPEKLTPRDHVDLLVGQGQGLYLSDQFGASAELFDNAIAQGYLLTGPERLVLLDWWANALDRSAQVRPAEKRIPSFERVVARMEEELRRDPANPVANYWLPVAVRGVGDIERAWDAAISAWVRIGTSAGSSATVRSDIDRFVSQVLIPERVRMRGGAQPQDASRAMREEWELVKQQWK